MFRWRLIMASHVWSRQLFTYKWTLYLKPCPRTDWCKKKGYEAREVEVNLRCLFETVPVQMRDILLKNGSPGLLYPRYRCSTSSSHPLFFLAWWQLQTPIPRWIVRGSPPQQTDVCYREPQVEVQFSSLDQQSLHKTGPKLTLHIQIWRKRSMKERILDPEHPSQNYSGLSQVPELQSMS